MLLFRYVYDLNKTEKCDVIEFRVGILGLFPAFLSLQYALHFQQPMENFKVLYA